MNTNNSSILFPILTLIVIFSEQLGHALLIWLNSDAASNIMKYVFMVVAFPCYCIFFNQVIKYHHSKKIWCTYLILFLIPFLYYLTSVQYAKYTNIPNNYYSYLLRYCSMSFSACIIGINLSNHPYRQKIESYLPLFITIFGLTSGSVAIESAISGKFINFDSGINYQNISYALAELYAYCLFYLFFSSKSKENKVMRIIIIFMIFYSSVLCLVSGGRGAAVYMVFISAYIIYWLLRQNIIRRKTFVFVATLYTCIFIGILYHFNVFESVGFERITDHISDSSSRDGIFEKSIATIMDSPIIGHGLGSVWMTVGIYSHNMIMDFLVETGLIGCILLSCIIIIIIYKLSKRIPTNYFHLFILLVFLKTLIMDMFSSYWISSYQLWFAFGYVIALPKIKINNHS